MPKSERIIFFCLILVFVLRLPSLFEPYWYGDEGVYLTLGAGIRHNLLLYKNIYDNKPPLLYLLAALTGSVAWFRALLLIWMMTTTLFFWLLLKRLFTKVLLINISLILFAILSSIPVLEGNIANSEIFMIGLTILAFYLSYPPLTSKKITPFPLFISGLLLGLAFLLKVPAIFDFIALVAFIILLIKKNNWQLSLTKIILISSGFAIPLLLTLIYFNFNNALTEYITSAFMQNFGYVSSWSTGSMSGGLTSKIGLLSRAFATFMFFLFLFIFRKKFSSSSLLIFIWFAFALFATLLSGRPYAHYLIQLLPPFVILMGFLLSGVKFPIRLISISLMTVLVITEVFINFWFYPVGKYYLNFIQYTLGQKNQTAYFSEFSWQTNTTYSVSQYLSERLTKGEQIFIWGDFPYIYALSGTLPSGRYTVAYHIVDYQGYSETITSLQKNPPRYILVDENEKRPFPEFFQVLQNRYTLEKQIDFLKIYHRLPETIL